MLGPGACAINCRIAHGALLTRPTASAHHWVRFTSGRFAANSNISGTNADAAVSGTFNGRRMDITLSPKPAGLAAAYTGQFIDDATVTLSPVGGGTAFNVVRNGPRPATCPASG